MNRLGLIGYPLGHSFSQAYFKRKFQEESIHGWSYELFPMKSVDNLRSLIQQNPELVGLNVTIPHKINVMTHMDELSAEAREAGAVNTVKIVRSGQDFSLHGYNTDVYGFRQSLIGFLKGARVSALVLGSGGASKAVTYVLRQLEIPYRVVSRTPGKSMYSYSQIGRAAIENHSLIINTTPVGMYPKENTFPDILYSNLTTKHFFYDLVYNPEETLFLKKAKMFGAAIKNGLEMLHLQAEKSWEIWTSELP